MERDSQLEVYFVHVWIREIHPMLWHLDRVNVEHQHVCVGGFHAILAQASRLRSQIEQERVTING
jgi:hypothetical protein